MLRWTHSNAVTLEKIGHDAAVAFAEARQDKEEFDRKYRYYNYVKQKDRYNDFLRPFAHFFGSGGTGPSSPGEAVNG